MIIADNTQNQEYHDDQECQELQDMYHTKNAKIGMMLIYYICTMSKLVVSQDMYCINQCNMMK